jgi:dienelactone hydrolase
MAEVLLFHHALGLTAGCLAFADDLRAAGHVVHTPDLYEGKTFADQDDGVAYAEEIGFDEVVSRGVAAASGLSPWLVYAGLSLGVLPAQALAQTRSGARGAVLLHGAVPTLEFGVPWPPGVAVQIHTMAEDDWGDVDVARDLAEEIDGAELYVYPGDKHLFTDRSLPDYDADAAALVLSRVLAFLARL